MKEATGEANITVITIVLIAIVLAIGTVVVNSVLNTAKRSSCCTSVGGIWAKGKCWTQGCSKDFSDKNSFVSNWKPEQGNGHCWTLTKSGSTAEAQNYSACLSSN